MHTVPFIPENAPFRPEQRVWLNGYLAGLCATVGVPADSGAPTLAAPTAPLAILYGSQTGTAEGLAKKIGKEAKGRGWVPEIVAADDFAKIDWTRQTRLLVAVSTYGDGEMPDNAQAFWAWFQSDAGKALAHLDYAVLALGDTNYPEFCAAGRKIDARLEALGAKRLHPRADCDADYEEAAKEWMGGMLAALGAPAGEAPSAAPAEEATVETGWSKTRPFPARLAVNRKLNADGSAKETRHFEISLEGSGLTYEAGDALGIVPSNCPALVDDLLALLGLADAALRETLRTGYDITKPSAALLKQAAKTNPALAALLAPEQKEALRSWLWGREVYDVFAESPAFRPDGAGLLAVLKKMAPRLYSISSSPEAHLKKDASVHLTVGIVRHEAHGRRRKGVCSTFLADLAAEGVPVPVFVQPSHGFRPPADGNVPIVMVGPGTGIAPFRAFLHERLATGAKGKNWLFFGDQRAATDFYYRDELEAMFSSGHLTRLSTAFSRDQEEKIYVQTRMREEGAALWSWLQEGAHFYVCGDASRMAKDIDTALHAVIEREGNLSPEAAAAYVRELKNAKRYQRDVY